MSDLFQASDLAGDAPRPLADRLGPKACPKLWGKIIFWRRKGLWAAWWGMAAPLR